MESKQNVWTKIQEEIRSKVKTESGSAFESNPQYVAGMDISFFENDAERAVASLVVCSWQEVTKIEWERHIEVRLKEAYIPNFLSFREVDHLIFLWKLFET